MKKYISILGILSLAMSLILSPVVYAKDLDPSNLTTAQIEKERDSHPGDMSKKQQDVLRAFGVSEDELKTITKGEIKDILFYGDPVKPEYLVPYIASKEEIKESIEKTKKAREEQLLRFEQNGLTGDDLDLLSENILFADIAKMSIPNIEKIIEDAKAALEAEDSDFTLQYITPNVYTRFNKYDIGAYESGTYLYFHRDSMDTSYASIATSAHISEVSDYVNIALTIGKDLYNVGSLTQEQYARNLFGELTEGSSSSTNVVHEGIDYSRYEGAPVYCLADDGVVYNIADEYGGKTVAIYDWFWQVTVIYMHLKNVSVSQNDSIEYGDSFAQQGRYIRGTENNTHVHVEVRDGLASFGNNNTGETLSSERPYYIILFMS